MKNTTAPYNFVPLAANIYFPPWADQASQDWPFRDGVSGTLEYEIEALGPIFLRGKATKKEERNHLEFFRTPDHNFAIPGSSVRGLLRNVVQIASFGKLAPINDHRYGIRDLHNRALYGDHMATLVRDVRGRGPGEPVPLVNAGLLRERRNEGEEPTYFIEPCSFAKIEYGFLRKLQPEFRPGDRQSSPDKYESWKRLGGKLEIAVTVSDPMGNEPRRVRGCAGSFHKVTALGGNTKGTLVFTGQPTKHDPNRVKRRGAGNPKHHDFVFFGPSGRAIALTPKQMDDFRFIHSDSGQQGRARDVENKEWGHWKKRFEHGEAVPIFYLPDGRNAVRSFGLAMMFRLAYRHSIAEIADANQHPGSDGASTSPRRRAALDIAETLFGTVPGHDMPEEEKAKAYAIKGRVSIGLAGLKQGKTAGEEVVAVLGAPKASFYPNYVEQGEQPQAAPGAEPRMNRGRPEWKTYQDGDARLRGWKRYRPQQAIAKPELPAKSTDRVKTWFRPIEGGARFTGRIRVHNLRPVELGALIWALDFGAADQAEHMLGMARSLGYGRVRIRVTGCELRTNEERKERGLDFLETARMEYESTLETWCGESGVPGGWRHSAQLVQLLACAAPLPAGSTEGRHLSIAHPADRNQFVTAKKQGAVLAPAAQWRMPNGARTVSTRSVQTERGAPPPPIELESEEHREPPRSTAPERAASATVIADHLILKPGQGVWVGTALLKGKRIRLEGSKSLEGFSNRQRKKKTATGIKCEVEHAGGTNYRIVRVVVD